MIEKQIAEWVLDGLSPENNEFKFEYKYFEGVKKELSLMGLTCEYDNEIVFVWIEDNNKYLNALSELYEKTSVDTGC